MNRILISNDNLQTMMPCCVSYDIRCYPRGFITHSINFLHSDTHIHLPRPYRGPLDLNA